MTPEDDAYLDELFTCLAIVDGAIIELIDMGREEGINTVPVITVIRANKHMLVHEMVARNRARARRRRRDERRTRDERRPRDAEAAQQRQRHLQGAGGQVTLPSHVKRDRN